MTATRPEAAAGDEPVLSPSCPTPTRAPRSPAKPFSPTISDDGSELDLPFVEDYAARERERRTGCTPPPPPARGRGETEDGEELSGFEVAEAEAPPPPPPSEEEDDEEEYLRATDADDEYGLSLIHI